MPVASEEIVKTIEDCMKDVFEVDEVSIGDETTADDIEEWDSLSHVRLLVALERAFNIRFTNAEIDALQSANVGGLVKTIAAKVR
jgi:acyl carrier protein